jgi:hypothetical protein
MRRAEGIVFTLRTLGETRKPATLTQRPHPRAPTGDDLVRIGLVAHVPDQPVVRGVKNVMKGDGELDDSEAGAQVTSRDRNHIDKLGTQLVGKLAKRRTRQGPQLVGRTDAVQQGRLTR